MTSTRFFIILLLAFAGIHAGFAGEPQPAGTTSTNGAVIAAPAEQNRPTNALNQGVGRDQFVPGEVVIAFKAGADEAAVDRAVQAHGLRVKKHLRTAPMRSKGERGLHVLQTGFPVEEALKRLNADPAVEFAEPNWIYTHQATANDPYFSGGNLWGVYGDNTTPANAYGSQAAKAWAAGYTGTNTVYVGIIDEGVQWQHPDLAGNMWSNRFDPVDGVDNDGNGYVDDSRGWDFYSSDASVYDNSGDDHGTHVAGTIGATGQNGAGVAGVNWRVTLIPAKFMGADGGTAADAVEAVDYMVDLKVRHKINLVALNNSWGGGGYSRALHSAIIRAAKAGILFIAAAGNGDAQNVGINNDATPMYPAGYDTTKATTTESAASYNSVIAVAAIDSGGRLATFSNYGSKSVHLGAPGVNIWSTVSGNGYSAYNGTSMATPHVAGAAALYASTHPSENAATIRNAILTAATPTSSLTGKTSTGGRLNVSNIIAPASVTSSTNGGSGTVKLTAPRAATNTFQFRIQGPLNQVYEIQRSTNLTTWAKVSTVTNVTGTLSLSMPAAAGKDPRQFYRSVVRP